jgi:hypothetical protein
VVPAQGSRRSLPEHSGRREYRCADDSLSTRRRLRGGIIGWTSDSYCRRRRHGSAELIGFTSAHCGGPGAQVVAQGTDNRDTLGSITSTDNGLAYAVIKFDPAKVAPTANFAGFPINGIGPDPSYQQPVCTQGSATGQGCGAIAIATVKPGIVGARVPAWQPGDYGAPLTVNDQLIGLTQNGTNVVEPYLVRVIMHTNFTLFSAILGDVNAKGGPGAGFSPIPA